VQCLHREHRLAIRVHACAAGECLAGQENIGYTKPMMTGRERVSAILHKSPRDRISWTALVDENTLSLCPAALQGNGGLDLYRHLGCDVMLLNGWGLPYELRSPSLQWGQDVTQSWQQDGEVATCRWRTPAGELVSASRRGHPLKFPVTTVQELAIYRRMWENASYVAHDDHDTAAAINAAIGDDGLFTRFWGPSTIPSLLEYVMGLETFYYLQADCPKELDSLIRLMHAKEFVAFEALGDGPWENATLVENTSTAYISPAVYERYNMPHQRDFVAAMHRRGKVAILHMCGHVRGLLGLIRQTDCDGIHFLTPPPTGDCPWEAALDALGEDLVIIALLDPSIFISGPLTGIGPQLDRLITPRIRQSNFILCTTADGIAVPLDRFEAVKAWFDRRAR
jgi:hypothetical protein